MRKMHFVAILVLARDVGFSDMNNAYSYAVAKIILVPAWQSAEQCVLLIRTAWQMSVTSIR